MITEAFILATLGIILFVAGVVLGISIQKQAETYAKQRYETEEGDQ